MYSIPSTELRKTPGAWGEFSRCVVHYDHHIVITRSLSHVTDDPSPQLAAVGVSYDWWLGSLVSSDPPENGTVETRYGNSITVQTYKTNEARPGLPGVLNGAVYRGRHTCVYRYNERALVFMPAADYQTWTGTDLTSMPFDRLPYDTPAQS